MFAAVQVIVDPRATPQDIQQANQFLLQYFELKESFIEVLQFLLSVSDKSQNSNFLYIRQFCATTLYKKVRRHWNHQLNEEERSNFVQSIAQSFVSQLLSASADLTGDSDNTQKIYEDLIMRMLSASVLRSPSFLGSYFQLADQCLKAQAFPPFSRILLIGIRMYTILYEEYQDLDSNRRGKSALEQELQPYFKNALSFVSSLLLTMSRDHLPSESASLGVKIVLLQFLRFALEIQGLNFLHDFHENQRHSLEFILQQLFLTDRREISAFQTILSISFNIVLDLVTSQEYPRNEMNEKIRDKIIDYLLHQSTSFLTLLSAESSNEIASDSFHFIQLQELLRAFITLVLKDLQQFSIISSEAGELSQRILYYFQKILFIISLPNRKFLLQSFDFWFEIQELIASSLEEDKVLFNHVSILRKLFEVLFVQCLYPVNDGSKVLESISEQDCLVEEDIMEDFETLRNPDFGVEELLQLCFDYNSSDCLQLLQQQLLQISQLHQSLPVSSWQSVDGLLFVTTSCMKGIKEKFSIEMLAPFLFQLSIISLHYLNVLSSLPASSYCQHFVRSFAKFISSISFLLVQSISFQADSASSFSTLVDQQKGIFFSSLRFCLSVVFVHHLDRPECSKICSQLFQKLCVLGKEQLTRSREDLVTLLQSFLSIYPPINIRIEGKFSNLFVESFAGVFFSFEETGGGELLTLLAKPFIEVLQTVAALSIPRWKQQHFSVAKLFINHCQHILRATNSLATNSFPTSPFLSSFVSVLFPILSLLLQQLLAVHQRNQQHLEILSAIFSSYSLVFPIATRLSSLRKYRADIVSQLTSFLSRITDATAQQNDANSKSASVEVRIFLQCMIECLDVCNNDGIADIQEKLEYEKTFRFFTETVGNKLLTLLVPPAVGTGDSHLQSLDMELDSYRYYFDLCLVYLRNKREELDGSPITERMFRIAQHLLLFSLDRDCMTSLCYSLQSFCQFPDFQSALEYAQWEEHFAHFTPLLTLLIRQISLPLTHSALLPVIGDSLATIISSIYKFLPPQRADECLQGALLQASGFVTLLQASVAHSESEGERREETQSAIVLVFRLLRQMSIYKNRRYRSFINDLHRLCLGEETFDVLIGYSEELIE